MLEVKSTQASGSPLSGWSFVSEKYGAEKEPGGAGLRKLSLGQIGGS